MAALWDAQLCPIARAGVTGGAVSGGRAASGCHVVAAMKLRAREQGHDERGWQQQQHQLRLYFP